MQKFNIKALFLLLILCLAAMPVLAQRTGGNSAPAPAPAPAPTKPTLSIECNVRNAQVQIATSYKSNAFISGTAPFSAQLERGTYTVTVSAPGYESKQETVNLSSSKTITVNLGADKASLQIRSNVRDAKVVISGGGVSGQLVGSAPFTAQMMQGRYNVTVSAPGYITTQREINLNGPQNITINLEAESYRLTVISNVENAKVFIRGGDINGQLTGTTEMSTMLSKGRYTIKVNAPGYFAEEQTLNLDETTTINIQLKPRTGRLDVIIPNEILDYSKSNPAGRVSIFDNGSEIDGTSIQLTPGQHTIRVTSGGFASQQTINVRAGESYRIELNFGFSLIKE